jgi:hypothetical protein
VLWRFKEPPEGFWNNDVSSSSGSDLEEDLGAEEDILVDIAPVEACSSPAMRELQSDDVAIARVRAWVEHGMRPPAIDLEAEGKGVQNMIVLWEELGVYNGVKAVVLPKKIRADVFRHLHASPMVGGHIGRDRTYNRFRSRAWWPGCRRNVYDWIKRCHDWQFAKPGPDTRKDARRAREGSGSLREGGRRPVRITER